MSGGGGWEVRGGEGYTHAHTLAPTLPFSLSLLPSFLSLPLSLPPSLPLSLYLQSLWKAGKRKAEKDELIAGMLFSTIEHQDVHMERDSAYVN